MSLSGQHCSNASSMVDAPAPQAGLDGTDAMSTFSSSGHSIRSSAPAPRGSLDDEHATSMHSPLSSSVDFDAHSVQSSLAHKNSSSELLPSHHSNAPSPQRYVEASFGEEDRPLGLVLGWSSSFPVVDAVQPGSAAAKWPQIVPGLHLLEVNNHSIPPDIHGMQLEDLLQARPLALCFGVVDDDGAPIHAYHLGNCYRALASIVIRESEDLGSRVLGQAASRAIMQVIDHGVGRSGRRLLIQSGGVTGWISCATAAGMLLLDTSPAQESEVDDDERRSSRGSLLDPSAAAELALREARHKRMKTVAEERARANVLADDDSVDGARNGVRKESMLSKICHCCGPKKPTSRPVLEFDDDSEEDDMIDIAISQAEAKRKLKLKRGEMMDLASYRDKAFWKIDIDPIASSADSKWVSFQRRTGIMELRIQILAKKIKVDTEGAMFPSARDLCEGLRFEIFIASMIVLNTVCIAAETFHHVDSKPGLLALAEHLFTFLFVVEFSIRIAGYSWVWCFNLMNMFDSFLIWITGVLVMWILVPAGVEVAFMRRLGCLRILRLARVCRVLRTMPLFKDLWMLVQGVMSCGSLLLWVMIIGSVIHYLFAVATMELVSKDPKFEDDAAVQELFGSLPSSMFTLFQMMTFDSWAIKVTPIIQRDPKTLVIFGVFLGLAGIVLFELMTAVVIRNAFDTAAKDTEVILRTAAIRDAKVRVDLKTIFQDLDEDQSGYLSIEEFLECMEDFAFVRKMKMLDIDLEELPDIFEILDDGDGMVEQEEFISGMLRMQGTARSSEMLKATCGIKQQNVHFVALEDAFVQNAMQTFRNVEGHVDTLHENTNDVISLMSEIVGKLDTIGMRKVVGATVPNLPFMMDPTVDEIQYADKVRKKEDRRSRSKQRRGSTASVEAVDRTDPESFMQKTIPPAWIIRNGRSPLAKNPGKVKLMQNEKLKEKLMTKKVKKQEVSEIVGAAKGFQEAWAGPDGLGLHLNSQGLVESYAVDYGEPPPTMPSMADSLHSWFIAPNSHEDEPDKPHAAPAVRKKAGSKRPPDSVPNVTWFDAAQPAKYLSLTPQVPKAASKTTAPHHPNAVP